MSITVQSTTDSESQITAAHGGSKEPTPTPGEKEDETEVTKAAAGEELAEKLEASEAQEQDEDENEEIEAKGDPEKEPKKKNGVQKRIDKLRAKATAAEQEKNYWRDEALKNQKPAQQTSPAQEQASNEKPSAEKFSTHEEYVEALTTWKVEQKLSEREQKSKEAEQLAKTDEYLKAHAERVGAFSKEHDDFDELLEAVNDVKMSPTIQKAIVFSESSAELMYELSKNRAELERICSLDPILAVRELSKFEAKTLGDRSSQTKQAKVTKAPPPIAPVGARSSSATKDPSEMGLKEYRKWREAQG